MTRKDAYQMGVRAAKEAIIYGHFSAAERNDADGFSEAFEEIIDNQNQSADYAYMASAFNKARNSEALWGAYENGIEDVLNKYLEENFE